MAMLNFTTRNGETVIVMYHEFFPPNIFIDDGASAHQKDT